MQNLSSSAELDLSLDQGYPVPQGGKSLAATFNTENAELVDSIRPSICPLAASSIPASSHHVELNSYISPDQI